MLRLKPEDDRCKALELRSGYGLSEHVGGHVCCAKVLELYDAFLDIVDHE